MSKTYPIQNSVLYRLRNRRKLAVLLGLPPTFFRRQRNYQYREFTRPKPNGDGIRYYSVPENDLKRIQKRLCRLLMRIETPEWIVSGKRHHSYVTNAMRHIDSNHIKTMDISSFYDSANKNYVFRMFQESFLMEEDIARILTNLVTYKGKLPTGSPTSQIVIFWAYREMFERINELAQVYNCVFTLYVDDMTFSSQKPIPKLLRNEVDNVLKKYGFLAKAKKDHYYQGKQFKIVTGVGINNGVPVVLNRHRKKILDQYRKCKETQNLRDIMRLKGMLHSARQIEPQIFPSIMEYIDGFKSTNIHGNKE